jgi:hypothetical protein
LVRDARIPACLLAGGAGAGGPLAVVIVHPSFGVTNFRDFVAAARKSKEPISYISPSTGSNGFLAAEYLARQEGYKITHIPYKRAGPALTDLLAGHVKLGTITFSSAAEQIRAGKLTKFVEDETKRWAPLARSFSVLIEKYGGLAAAHARDLTLARVRPRNPPSGTTWWVTARNNQIANDLRRGRGPHLTHPTC